MEDLDDSGIDHTPPDQHEDYDENMDGDEPMDDDNDEEYNGDFRQQNKRGRGGFRGRGGMNRMDFGGRGPPMGQGGPHGPPPRFRGRGFGPRGPPPGFRGHGPPPFGPGGPGNGVRGPRFRGGPPPPGYDPNWGPMPPGGMPPHGGPPPHMMGPPGGPGMGERFKCDGFPGEDMNHNRVSRSNENNNTRNKKKARKGGDHQNTGGSGLSRLPRIDGGQPPPHMMGGPGPGGPPMGMPPPGGPFGPPPGMGGPGPGQNPNGPPPMMGPPPGNMGGNNGPGGPGGGPGGPNGPPPMNMPPPNMGPNSGPPGGPPQLDLSGEVWVEAKSGEGKSYFYNARTRETTWTKPEGNVKIIMQEQVEAMAQAAGVNPMGQGMPQNQGGPNQPGGPPHQGPPQGMQQDMDKSGPPPQNGPGHHPDQQPPNQPPPGFMPNNVGMPPPGSMPPTGMPPPVGMPQGGMPPPGGMPGGPPLQPPPLGMPPPMGMPPPFGGPGGPYPGAPFGLPPPGFPFPGGFPPPWAQMQMAQGPPAGGPPTISAPPITAGIPPTDDSTPQIDPEIVGRAAEWTEHRAPDGRFYYYNAKAGESVWEKPQPLKDLEAAKQAAAQGLPPVVPTPVAPAVVGIVAPAVVTNGVPPASTPTPSAAPAKAEEPLTGAPEEEPAEKPVVNGDVTSETEQEEKLDPVTAAPSSADETEKPKATEKQNQQQQQPQQQAQQTAQQQEKSATDKSKPVSSNPVPGTPWCVVWTGDGRVFFYNPSSRTSVWERPEELSGRADVDKLVSSPPEAVVAASETPVKREAPQDADSGSAAKKQKVEPLPQPQPKPVEAVKEEKAEKKAIDIGKEAAMEAEVRAARERAIVPLETRIKSFREMLSEKEVSAFSTWEKELHKIVFDPRYLLLTSKERKQVFEKYVKERAEEERREKRNKMKERKEEFRRLMQEASLHGKSSFADFATKYAKDERFKNVEKMRERESLFNEYILEVRKREKEEKVQKRDQVRKDFFNLLKESADVDRHSRWGDVKKKLDSDPRYKAVESSAQREDWFREYVKQLKDERKKEKDRRERDRERKDRDRDREERRERKKEKEEEKENKPEKEVEDEEMKEVEDGEKEKEVREKEAAEKAARVEASLREREKEVQRTLAVHLRDRDTEREAHKHDEAVQHFNALLADLVRNCELSWREAKRQLRKDHRWELAELLDREEKEKLFNAHIEQLTLKKKEKFRELLNETAECTLSSTWKEVRKVIKDDPRYSKFSSSDRKCEREFKEYIKDKIVAAKADLRELLQETKLITHKSNALVEENESHMKEVEEMLEKDKRYLVLNHIPDERREILKAYLVELEKRGPPPPPTACDPSRRSLK